MNVTVQLFSVLRETAGTRSIPLELPDRATVGDAVASMRSAGPLSTILERMPVRMAVNREYADDGQVLAEGDELALVSPVSGGSDPPRIHARISEQPLSLDAISALVVRDSAGAVVSFQGMTRDVDRLDYEAYAEMAHERIEALLAECADRHGLEAAAAEHRVGSVPLGEPSVIVAVSAAHREEAFSGAREAIDRIKAEAPIWKAEVEGGESRWVQGTEIDSRAAERHSAL